MLNDQVVLVDRQDNELGLMDKLEAHRGQATLHRAISVLLFRTRSSKLETLMQRRAKTKLTWPLFWSNTVCTHPFSGETPHDSAKRRLTEELGIDLASTQLKHVFTFQYHAQYNQDFSEREVDHVFIGSWDGAISLNPEEVEEVRWIGWDDLQHDMKINLQKYTPWFIQIINQIGKVEI